MLLASGFVHPALLSGLALVALPIVIHLLSRRQFRRMDWAATYFLLQAERENRRRTRFEQWLLLALRCLAVALLALLVARPFVQPGLIATLLGEEAAAERIVVIDDSASLTHQDGAGTDFAALRAAAERLVGWLAEGAAGDGLTILRTSAEEPVLSVPAFSSTRLEEVRAAVRGLEPVLVPADPQRALGRLAGRISGEGGRRAEVYLLSDFQRSDWTPPDGSPLAALTALDPDRLRVTLMAVADPLRANVAVTSVRPDRPQALAGFPAVYRAEVANRTARPIEGRLLTRTLNEAALTPVPVERIEPGETRVVSFEVTIPEPGPATLQVGIDGRDGLPVDDVFMLVADVKPALRVALVNGEPATRPVEDETHFLRSALAPPGAANSGMQVEVLAPGELAATPLQRFDAILYCNAAVDPTIAAALRRYVYGGGGLVLVLGDQVGDGADWNRLLGGEAGLLPGRITGRVVRAERDARFGLVRVGEDPITAMLPDVETTGRGVRVQRFVEVQSDETGAAQVLARFTDASRAPAILRHEVGAGQVVLFTTPLDLEWNDWPRAVDGSYVVTMLELVHAVAPQGPLAPAYVSGPPLEVTLSPARYELRGTFRTPSYPEQPAVAGRVVESDAGTDAPARLVGPAARQLGLYTLELESRSAGVETRQLAVNLPPAETDLAAATAEELGRQLGGIEHAYLRAEDSLAGGVEESRRELWPSVLVLLFLTLLAEQTLAWWFGRHGRATLSETLASGWGRLRGAGRRAA